MYLSKQEQRAEPEPEPVQRSSSKSISDQELVGSRVVNWFAMRSKQSVCSDSRCASGHLYIPPHKGLATEGIREARRRLLDESRYRGRCDDDGFVLFLSLLICFFPGLSQVSTPHEGATGATTESDPKTQTTAIKLQKPMHQLAVLRQNRIHGNKEIEDARQRSSVANTVGQQRHNEGMDHVSCLFFSVAKYEKSAIASRVFGATRRSEGT